MRSDASIRGVTILEQIRRRSRSAASALLPMLVIAWMDAAALSCGGTPGDAADGTHTGAPCAHHASREADSDLAGHPASGEAHHAPGGPDPASAEHDGSGQSDHARAGEHLPAGPDHEGAEHGDAGCRHCAPATADHRLSSYDADCGTGDGAAADVRGRANGHDPQLALPPVLRLAPIAGLPPQRGRVAESPPPPASTTPLNIRYCVFLI